MITTAYFSVMGMFILNADRKVGRSDWSALNHAQNKKALWLSSYILMPSVIGGALWRPMYGDVGQITLDLEL